ncbi:MAG: hypothetical protein ACE15F_21885 [bacterium]
MSDVGLEQKEIKGYLVDVDTGEWLEFLHNPNDIGDDYSGTILVRHAKQKSQKWDNTL